jgi:hypothetical protein
LLNDWRGYLTDTDGHDKTNYDLHLRTGRPLATADFLNQLEQLIGMSLQPKKGGWQKGHRANELYCPRKFAGFARRIP